MRKKGHRADIPAPDVTCDSASDVTDPDDVTEMPAVGRAVHVEDQPLRWLPPMHLVDLTV